MQRLNVSFDIDGVVLASQTEYLKAASRILGREVRLRDTIHYSLAKSWGLTDEQEDDVIEESLTRESIPLMLGAEALVFLATNVLRKPISFITSRPRRLMTPTYYQLTEHFSGVFDFRVFHSRNKDDTPLSKVVVINSLGFDYHVEDHPQTALEVADETEAMVLLVDMPWNQKLAHPNVIRCGSWERKDQWDYVKEFLHRRANRGMEQETLSGLYQADAGRG